MSMGERIEKAIEESCGGNQSELARACSVRPSAVSQWVGGGTKPNCINVFHIEARTGFAARWIALGEGPEKVDPENITLNTREETDPLYEKIMGADINLRQAVENLLDQVLPD